MKLKKIKKKKSFLKPKGKKEPSAGEKKQLNVVWITSEAAPFAKTGGLADVSASLPEALAKKNMNVCVIMPYYPQQMQKYNAKLKVARSLVQVPFAGRSEWTQILEFQKSKNLKFLFIEYHKYFDRSALYDWNGIEYADNAERFIFFCRAAMQAIIAMDLKPDIIHANDWHSALSCVYLKSHLYKNIANFAQTKSILTIHNIAYQGAFHKSNLYFTGLGWDYFNHLCLEFHDAICLLKGGIMTADVINTVSPTHADEILSREGGFGLDSAIAHRASQGHMRGILNGIDIVKWNPDSDSLIPCNYSLSSLNGKKICKKLLQKELKLPQNPKIPLFGLISRFVYQKGIDVFAQAIDNILLYDDVQFVVLGTGDSAIENHVKYIAAKYPEKISFIRGYHEKLSHMIEAGADIFVMPSRYEPCGLNQMYSMRYGTLPLVRATGGLDDTVINYNSSFPNQSNGFKFWDLNPASLANTIRWAASVYRNDKNGFAAAQNNAMSTDFSWNKTAEHYEELYRATNKKI
jgi:starch synthase